jgi:adenine-specific DNA-methyltransferase
MMRPQQLQIFDSVPTAARFPSTRYQGSKQKYVEWIRNCIKDLHFFSALDAFGGTSCVSFMLKQEGKQVIYNDILPFNTIIGKALIENKNVVLEDDEIDSLIKPEFGFAYPHFIADTFHNIYFTDEENHWLDVVSTNIRRMTNPYKQAIAYFALFQACIIKRPYNLFHRKNLYVRLQDVKRSFGNKATWDTPFETHFKKFVTEANYAVFDSGIPCYAINEDVFNIKGDFDLVYIDTPYINEDGIGVDYADFYHFLNGIINYDKWNELIDYDSKHLRLHRTPNVWCDPDKIYHAFSDLFSKFSNSTLVISYRSNGVPSIDEITLMLESIGKKVSVYKSNEMKYVLSKRSSKEILIVAQ